MSATGNNNSNPATNSKNLEASFFLKFFNACQAGELLECQSMLEANNYKLKNRLFESHPSYPTPISPMSFAIQQGNQQLCSFLLKAAPLSLPNLVEFTKQAIFNKDIFVLIQDRFHRFSGREWSTIVFHILQHKIADIFTIVISYIEKNNIRRESFSYQTQEQILATAFSSNMLDICKRLIELQYPLNNISMIWIAKHCKIDFLLLYSKTAGGSTEGLIERCLSHAFAGCELVEVERFHQEIMKLGYQPKLQFKDILLKVPQSALYSVVKYVMSHLTEQDTCTQYGIIQQGMYDKHTWIMFPETVLSYLAYAQAYDAFKYIIENVPRTAYAPTHSVICSLFRGYDEIKNKKNIDSSGFMKLFQYILQDDIRPHVLGEDMIWTSKSIFTCIKYGSPAMCMKLFSYGIDKSDVYIESYIDDGHHTLARYSLLSYACQCQSRAVVMFLIDAGVCLDGSIVIPRDSVDGSVNDKEDNTDVDSDNDSDSNSKDDDDDSDRSDGSDDDDDDEDDDNDDEDDEDNISGDKSDITSPQNYIFNKFRISKKAWFEPYFNCYRLNKNPDIDALLDDCDPFERTIKNPVKLFVDRDVYDGFLGLLNMTPLGVAIRFRRLDIVKLLLERGANPNADTITTFSHLWVYCARRICEFHEDIPVYIHNVEYPIVTSPTTTAISNIEIKVKCDVEFDDIEYVSKRQKLSHTKKDATTFIDMDENKKDDNSHTFNIPNDSNASNDSDNSNNFIDDEYRHYSPLTNDFFGEEPCIGNEVAIIKELVKYGVDLLSTQSVFTGYDTTKFDIYNLCKSMYYPIELFEYLLTIPQLKEKITSYYIDSFRSNVLDNYHGDYSRRYLSRAVNTIDYLFQNQYLTFSMFENDDAFCQLLERKIVGYATHLRPVIEKHGFKVATKKSITRNI